MKEPQIEESGVAKYLQFLIGMVDDMLHKDILLIEDYRHLRIEHELFVRRIGESKSISQALKDKVYSLADDSEVFGDEAAVKTSIAIDFLQGGDLLEDRSEFGPTTFRVLRALRNYRSDLRRLLRIVRTATKMS